MKPYVALTAAAVAIVATVAMVTSCDPNDSGTPAPSVVVIDHHHPHTGTVHGSTSRKTTTRKTTRSTTTRRSGTSTTTRRSTTVTKTRR